MLLPFVALFCATTGYLSIVIFVWRWTNWRTFNGSQIRNEAITKMYLLFLEIYYIPLLIYKVFKEYILTERILLDIDYGISAFRLALDKFYRNYFLEPRLEVNSERVQDAQIQETENEDHTLTHPQGSANANTTSNVVHPRSATIGTQTSEEVTGVDDDLLDRAEEILAEASNLSESLMEQSRERSASVLENEASENSVGASNTTRGGSTEPGAPISGGVEVEVADASIEPIPRARSLPPSARNNTAIFNGEVSIRAYLVDYRVDITTSQQINIEDVEAIIDIAILRLIHSIGGFGDLMLEDSEDYRFDHEEYSSEEEVEETQHDDILTVGRSRESRRDRREIVRTRERDIRTTRAVSRALAIRNRRRHRRRYNRRLINQLTLGLSEAIEILFSVLIDMPLIGSHFLNFYLLIIKFETWCRTVYSAAVPAGTAANSNLNAGADSQTGKDVDPNEISLADKEKIAKAKEAFIESDENLIFKLVYLNEKFEQIKAHKTSTLEDLKLRTTTYENPLYLKFIRQGRLLNQSKTIEELNLVPALTTVQQNKNDQTTSEVRIDEGLPIILHCFESRPKGCGVSNNSAEVLSIGNSNNNNNNSNEQASTSRAAASSSPNSRLAESNNNNANNSANNSTNNSSTNNSNRPAANQESVTEVLERLLTLIAQKLIIFISNSITATRRFYTTASNSNSFPFYFLNQRRLITRSRYQTYLQTTFIYIKSLIYFSIQMWRDGICFIFELLSENFSSIILGIGILYSFNVLSMYAYGSSGLIKSVESGPMSMGLSAVSFLSVAFVYLLGFK